jgi:hypothetical protein
VRGRTDLLVHAAKAFGFSGTLLPEVPWGGATVPVVVQIDEDEIQRRHRFGLESLDDYWAWKGLVDLPEGEPVPWDAIDPLQRRFLEALPDGVVEAGPRTVTRLIRPAIRPLLAIDVGPARRSIWRVSTFATLSHRAVVLGGRASRSVIADADSLHIGVAVTTESALRVVRHPVAPHRRDPFGYFRLCELLYALVLQERAGLRDG